MSATPDPYDATSAPVGSPVSRRSGSRHRAPDDGRRLMWSAVAGAGVVVAVAVVAVSCSGGEPAPSGPAGAFGTPVETATVDVTESPVPAETSPTPSPSPSSPPTVRPADLLAGLQATLDGLARDGELRRGAGNELRKRLREVSERLAEGDRDKAREKLREFADKLVDLRKEDKIDAGGYETLAALTRQLAQALSSG